MLCDASGVGGCVEPLVLCDASTVVVVFSLDVCSGCQTGAILAGECRQRSHVLI